MRLDRAASSPSSRWTSPVRIQLGPQSFHSVVEERTLSKSFMSMPLATKRGFQWLAASCTRFNGSAAIRFLLDPFVFGAPGLETAALVVILERVRLRLHELAVQLRVPVVRLPRPAREDLVLRSGRGEDFLVVVARPQRVERGGIQIGERDAGVVALREHALRRGDAGPS